MNPDKIRTRVKSLSARTSAIQPYTNVMLSTWGDDWRASCWGIKTLPLIDAAMPDEALDKLEAAIGRLETQDRTLAMTLGIENAA